MNLDTVDRMTITQVINAFNGYYEKESERSKALKIIGWETTRWQTWMLVNIQLKKKDRIKDPSKLLRLEWDEKDKPLTKEEKEILNNRFGEKPRFNGNK